ncbi:MAG: glycosyltransferase family 39 protein [Clostridia bacterium]|nr:glycosyltransferase family 39 protein [Clostridia bacterium]
MKNMKTNSIDKLSTRILSAFMLMLLLASTVLLMGAGGGAQVKNGDFESISSNRMPEGWTYASYLNDTSISTCVTVADAVRGNVVKLMNTEEDDAHLVQTVAVQPNTIYRFYCFVKTEDVSGGAGANIGLEDKTCYSNSVFGTTDWTLVELVGKTGAKQNKLAIGCRLGNYSAVSKGSAYFDGFHVEKLDSYAGTVQSFERASGGNGGNNDSGGNQPENPKSSTNIEQYTARMKMGALTVSAYVIVPLAIWFILHMEHVSDKKKGDKAIKTPAQLARSIFDTRPEPLPKKTDTKLRYTKLDWILVCALTAIYAVLAVTNLGSTNFPDTEWRGKNGTSVRFVFDGQVEVASMWQNCGITGGGGESSFTLTGEDGKSAEISQKYGIMYRWNKNDFPASAKPMKTGSITMTITKGEGVFNEVAFFDSEGKLLPVRMENAADAALVDEQSTVPEYPNYMVGMYFDELYHARTAYEHKHYLKVYETTHPPLGKIIISIGISIFGMNPFGWRIMGALFGVAMLPLMYAFGKRMFGRSWLAFLAAGLMAFDFMHFAQTRISTIDVYGVFFNLCMTYYMYKFIRMDLGDSLKDTLKPLALSGLFFGIGCASKWICVYTGAALAAMFFIKLIVTYIKAKKINSRSGLDKNEPAVENAKGINKRVIVTCLWCVVFFIIVPVTIYLASYFPYYKAEWAKNAENTKIAQMRAAGELAADEIPEGSVLTLGEKVKAYWEGVKSNQEYMYNYHSGLDSTHSYQSSWYEWPLSNRPMWFYAGYNHPDSSLYGTISSFGNPAVWWVCFAGTLFMVLMTLRGRFKLNTDIFFLLMCMASSMLPWMLVSRCVFIYHYFATVPLIILSSVYVLKHYEDKYHFIPKEKRIELSKAANFIPYYKFIWLGLAVLLFIVFYPVITGIPVAKTYVQALQWLPTWSFTGGWPSIWPN